MKYYLPFFLLLFTACSTTKQMKPGKTTNKVVAHRGAWKNTGAPQNSMASLKAAIQLRCVGSETDVHMTADSFIVVNHDPHYEGIDIQNSTLETLRAHKLKNGEDLPLLTEFLEEIVKQDDTKLVIEIKSSQRGLEWAKATVAKVVKHVKDFKADDHVMYISFSYDMCTELVKLVPEAHVQYLNGDKSPTELKRDGITGLDYHFSVFHKHPEYIGEAKKLGMALNAWTVNDTQEMKKLFAQGFDYITTDEPEKALELERSSAVAKGWKVVWNDEFDGQDPLPDEQKWSYNTGGDGWGNNEKQFYTAADTSSVFVKNGSLSIIARNDGVGDRKYTSARLVTKGKGEWKYGRMEMRAKLPAGRGLWPAFWMLGRNIDKAGWPLCGEIDIMEHVGYKPGVIFGTVHTATFNHMKGTQVGKETAIRNPYDHFHVYAIEWNEEQIEFFLDEEKYFEFKNEHKTVSEWPFDQPFFVIVNLAVGGNLGGAQGVDDSVFPAVYEIDYVRVFQKIS